jgi:dynactin complex subunit
MQKGDDGHKRKKLEAYQSELHKQLATERNKLKHEWDNMDNVVDDYEKLYGMFKKY